MKLLLSKLGFVHRRLWQPDGTYRVAVLLGPPPLLGAGVATLFWVGAYFLPSPHATATQPPWATVSGPRAALSTDPPRVVAPEWDLPASGVPAGLIVGWRGSIYPVEINAAVNAKILTTPLAPLILDGPSLDLGRIIAASPATGRFAGVGMATFVVRVAGIYALTLRLQRADTERVTCLQQLMFAKQLVVSTLQLDLSGPGTVNFEPVSFALQPGLYRIAAAFGCWGNQQEKGAGTLSVLIRHPGEQDLRPARADDFLRSEVVKP